jgi:prepilin-type N-terminal cleavage/methylation domain-containing protein/prepilin-type processing-associated H-X9-DG protein
MSRGTRKRARGRPARRAFTLVELLVVISIIGMLMAMLLPAVQSARETARSNTCRNNMRNLAQAIFQYEGAKGEFPGYANTLKGFDELYYDRSWGFMVLPYIEHNDIYEAFTRPDIEPPSFTASYQPDQTIDLFLCPSDPPEGFTEGPPTSFVVNTGRVDDKSQWYSGGIYPPDWGPNGVFQEARDYDYTTTPPTRRPIVKMTTSAISNGDGMQNTVMLTENVDAQSWSLVGLDDISGGFSSYERQMGCYWHAEMDSDTTGINPFVWGEVANDPQEKRINQLIGLDPTLAGYHFARPSAFHPNGVNVAFCDTHVKFISQDINYLVWTQLLTSRAKTAQDPGEVPVNPADPYDPAFPDPIFRYKLLDEKDIQ